MIELRWVVPDHTTTKPRRLQYREIESDSEGRDWLVQDWTDVPVVVLKDTQP